MSKPTIICVDDEPIILQSLKGQLIRNFGKKYALEMAESGTEALEILEDLTTDGVEVPLIIADHLMPGMKGDELLVKIHEKHPEILKVMLTGQADATAVGNALNEGNLYRFLAKPWQETDLVLTVREGIKSFYQNQKLEQQQIELKTSYTKAQEEIIERKKAQKELQQALREIKKLQAQLTHENIYLKEEISLVHNYKEIIGDSDEMKYVFYRLEQVAAIDTTVLIQGETGTGKELIARAIHDQSKRKDKIMVKVNCAAMPKDLIESELFGHEKGAFTGADQRKIGRFELANEGTLFLDEIGEMNLDLQSKLLRAIEYGEFERLGSSKSITVDVRIITATNRDLEKEVAAGKFRRDLFYRLNVYPITLPPLRKRMSDLEVLVQHFLKKFSTKVGKQISTVSKKSLEQLQAYSWPGNVRELMNIIERAVILSKGNTLTIELPESKPYDNNHVKTMEEAERDHIIQVLKFVKGRVAGPKGAAKILDMHPNTLRSRMEKLEISVEDIDFTKN